MLSGQTQPDQRGNRPVSTQHRVSELTQRIRAQRHAVVERAAKPSKIIQIRQRARSLTSPAYATLALTATACFVFKFCEGNPKMIKRWSYPCHDDTPRQANEPEPRG